MATFFSNTDADTLQSEGSDMNHFVSLIVNNAGKYTAGITRKIKLNQSIHEESEYSTWDNKRVSGSSRNFTAEREYIQWFNLDIEVEKVKDNFEIEMFERIKAIRSSKINKMGRDPKNLYYGGPYKNSSYNGHPINPYNPVKGGVNIPSTKKEIKEPTLFDNVDDEFMIDYENIKLSENIVDWVVKQTITCSAIISNSSNIDVEKWARSMDSLYKKRFATKDEFNTFASGFVDFLVNYTEDPEATAFLDATEMSAVLAYQVKEKLSTLPKNEWLDTWIRLYDDYIL